MCAKCASAIDDDFRGFSSIRLVVNIIEMILLLLKYSFSPPQKEVPHMKSMNRKISTLAQSTIGFATQQLVYNLTSHEITYKQLKHA